MLLLLPRYLKISHDGVYFLYVFFLPQQAITAISAPGETIALWIKFGGKTALRVASESAIKQE